MFELWCLKKEKETYLLSSNKQQPLTKFKIQYLYITYLLCIMYTWTKKRSFFLLSSFLGFYSGVEISAGCQGDRFIHITSCTCTIMIRLVYLSRELFSFQRPALPRPPTGGQGGSNINCSVFFRSPTQQQVGRDQRQGMATRAIIFCIILGVCLSAYDKDKGQSKQMQLLLLSTQNSGTTNT